MPFVETYRAAVAPSDCDFLGHMNVSRYFQACSDGMFSFQTLLGLGHSDMLNGRRLSFAVVHAESDFRSEVLAGEVIVMMTGIENIGTKSATFRHRLFHAEGGELAFESQFKSVLLDLQKRRAVEVPDDIRAKAEAYMLSAQELD